MLTEKAGDVLPGRCQGVVQSRGNENLHDRLPRPAEGAGIEKRLLHVPERGRENDAAGVMFAPGLAGQAGEVGQLGECHIHAEGARSRSGSELIRSRNSLGSAPWSIRLRYSRRGIQVGNDRAGAESLTRFGDGADGSAALDDHFLDGTAHADVHAARGC